MRTDCTIDGKQVVCKNASLIGYGSYTARVGCYFTYNDGGTVRHARMLGRIAFAPALTGDKAHVENRICALVLGEHGNAYERWIDPLHVLAITPVPTKLTTFFFQERLPFDVHTMRRLIEHGTMSEHYIDNASAHIAEWQRRAAQS